MSEKNRAGFATRAIHAGQKPDPLTGAIMTPIYASSTFVQASPGQENPGHQKQLHQGAARAAFDDGRWSQRSPRDRGQILIRLAELIRENTEELQLLETVEQFRGPTPA